MTLHIHIKRKEGIHDILPVYSTAQLLQGVFHPIHIPENEIKRLTRIEQQRESREKFMENREQIYTLLAQGRGMKWVACRFRIGYDALQKYLDEEENK